ncbi:cytochrome C biogenesis protein CcdA, partial [Acetobacter malorum]
WLSSRGQTSPAPQITTADIAAARATRKSAGMVALEREELDHKSPLP